MCRTLFKRASKPAISFVDEGPHLAARCRPTYTHHEEVSQRRSDHKTTRHTIHDRQCCVQITLLATLSRSSIASVGTGTSQPNWTHGSRHVMQWAYSTGQVPSHTFLLIGRFLQFCIRLVPEMKPCEIRKNGRWTQRYCVSNVSTTMIT